MLRKVGLEQDPKKLHKLHNNFTLAPECLEINTDHLSPYAKEALVQSGCREKYKDSKLVTTYNTSKCTISDSIVLTSKYTSYPEPLY